MEIEYMVKMCYCCGSDQNWLDQCKKDNVEIIKCCNKRKGRVNTQVEKGKDENSIGSA